jgi:guanylate kinase
MSFNLQSSILNSACVSEQPGILYIISAPSGAGKTSLINALVADLPNMQVSVSHTTRASRPGEKEGVDYYFVSQDKFSQMIAANTFLEYATVFDEKYGTSKQVVEDVLQAGRDVVLIIDWQGAQQVRKMRPQAVSIFILPPSLEALKERILERKQDTEDSIEKRLNTAASEIAHCNEYDYIIINDRFADALAKLEAIVRSNSGKFEKEQAKAEFMVIADGCKREIQLPQLSGLLTELMV